MARSFFVYRVEHPESGVGPYNGGYWKGLSDMRSDHSDNNHLAPPWDKALRPIMRRYGSDAQCGTATSDALRAWFAGHWDNLAAAGFVVRKVRAYAGSTRGEHGQAVYRASDARVVETFDIDTFVSA